MNKRLLLFLLFTGMLLIGVAFLRASEVSAGPNGPEMSSTHYRIDWSAAGEISGGTSASTHYKVQGTFGQRGANTSSTSAHYRLCTGWECLVSFEWLYLPLIQRQ